MNSNNDEYKLIFDELIDILPCALYVIKDSIIIDCNNAALNIFGYDSKSEIIGQRPYDLSPHMQKDGRLSAIKGQELIDSVMNNGDHITFKWTHKRKNGEYFWANNEIFNKEGVLYAIVVDVNEKAKLEKELDEKSNLYRMIFENHNSVMMIIEPNTGRILEANQAAFDYYGYSQDKLLNMYVQEINILSDSEIKKELKRAETEKRNYFQFIHRLANNERREVEIHSFPIKTAKGRLLFSFVYDISEKTKQKLMFDTLFFDSPYGVAILDKEQKIVNINRNFTKLFHYSLREIKGQAISNFVSPSGYTAKVNSNLELIYKGEVVKQEGIRKNKHGNLIDVEILGYPIINHQSIIGAYIMYIDISSKKAYEKQLLLFKKILENNSEGVVITDNNGYIEWINKAFNSITGYTLSDVKGKTPRILKSGIHDESFYKDMWSQLVSNGKWSGEIWNRNKIGDIYSEWLTINRINNESNEITHYVGILKDLSEKKKIDRRMNDLQQKDSLTGLYNRNYFLEKINTLINKYSESKEGFSVIFVDIEGFKDINSSLGHIIGDELLKELSRRLSALIENSNVLSRFSGDEFAILCSITNRSEVKSIAHALLSSIHEPFMIQNTMLHVTANIGISRFPENSVDSESLVRYADIAMYKAKEQVDEKICFYSREMSSEMEDKFYLANHLLGAITNDEFVIYLQPIIDIGKQEKIVGAEALLRWENAILGMVPPNLFIPIAEKTGQILSIGEWVLTQVCKLIDSWKSKGIKPIPISVNISVRQLEQPGFDKIVIDTMKKYNVEPGDIELELTESVSSGDLTTIVRNLKALKSIGIRISMDDFGTGFSSLGQLELFELDKLKIDKIFIDDLVNASRRQNIVKTIIAMAKSLDLTVVAEGIESLDQLSFLRELGCHLGQGYLFSRPVPTEEIEILLEQDKDNIWA